MHVGTHTHMHADTLTLATQNDALKYLRCD